MNILYITTNVLGDAGANAAELFPRYAFFSKQIKHVIVADFAKNKDFIKEKQFVEFLRIKFRRKIIRANLKNAWRIARKCKQSEIDIIHIFYRQVNIPLIVFLYFSLILNRSKAKILVDHRSINLAKGFKRKFKIASNQFMQFFVHHLAGNPLAVETNHYHVWRPKHIIDLGFDQLPEIEIEKPSPYATKTVWFIGSLKPKNRKSEFLIDVFDKIYQKYGDNCPFEIRVAGPTRNSQEKELDQNPLVNYYGSVSRQRLYELLIEYPGVGMAFMNLEHHAEAPSLKFSEYAAMGFAIVASNTQGLKIQYERMGYSNVIFAEENTDEWCEKLTEACEKWPESFVNWDTKEDWSYSKIFEKQCLSIYSDILNK